MDKATHKREPVENTELEPKLLRLLYGEMRANGYVPRAPRDEALEAHAEAFRRKWEKILEDEPELGAGWKDRLQRLMSDEQLPHQAAEAGEVRAGWAASAAHYARAAAHQVFVGKLTRRPHQLALELGLRVPTVPTPAAPGPGKPPAA